MARIVSPMAKIQTLYLPDTKSNWNPLRDVLFKSIIYWKLRRVPKVMQPEVECHAYYTYISLKCLQQFPPNGDSVLT
jgi:hypothetical protein